MKKAKVIVGIALVSMLAAGCASMNTVKNMPADIDAKVKSLQPPAGKALVYVVRPTFVGKPFGGTITANSEYVGTTQGGMYVYAVLAPGEYKVKVTGHDKVSEITVNLEPGKTYFIKQGVHPGMLKGFASLTVLDGDAGRKALQECKLGDKLGKNVAQ